jgi:hypothetical protein
MSAAMSLSPDDVLLLLEDYREARANDGDATNEALYAFLKRIAALPSTEHERLTGDCPAPLRPLWDAIVQNAKRIYPS